MKSETRKDDDAKLAELCRDTMPTTGDVPPFDALFDGATRRYRRARRRPLQYGAAAAIGVLAVSVFLTMDRDETLPQGKYIEMAELMSTTRWTAPSDVLLPRREFDLYGELPAIPASTKPAQGALL